MVTLLNIQARAEALSRKVEVGSITAEEVGTLFRDIAEYTQSVERDGSTLGIRKVYPSRETLEADTTAPLGHNGKPIRRGSLVAIYDEATATSDSDSGLVLMYTGEGFLPVARIGTALRHETTALETRLAETERLILEELRPKDTELQGLLESLTKSIQTTFREHTNALNEVKIVVGETSNKLATLKSDGKAEEYLAGDGSYHNLPSYGLSLSEQAEGDSNTPQRLSLTSSDGRELSGVDLPLGNSTTSPGGGFLNLSKEAPLDSGYYTLETALTALSGLQINQDLRPGLIISFESEEGKWQDWRFTGQDTGDVSFALSSQWQRYNELDATYLQEQLAQHQSRVDVAMSLDDSDRPVASSAVKEAIEALSEKTYDVDEEALEEGKQITLRDKGREVAKFVVPLGGGGTGSVGYSTKVKALLSHKRIKLGDSVNLSYGFTHFHEGEPDDTQAQLSLSIKRGAELLEQISLGRMTSQEEASLELSKYLKTADSYSLIITARYQEEGQEKERKAYAQLSVAQLAIDLYNKSNLEQAIARGGYVSTDNAYVIIATKGGARELSMYIDGNHHETKTLSGSRGNQTFLLPIDSLSAGRHSLQFVASVEGLRSNSIYVDILKGGSSEPFIGLLYSRSDGFILEASRQAQSQELIPQLLARQYEHIQWEYIAYTSEHSIAQISLRHPLLGQSTLGAVRKYQSYSTRFMHKGEQDLSYHLGQVSRNMSISVEPTQLSDIGIKEGAEVELTALGRSNAEAHPSLWGQAKGGQGSLTDFIGVDFASSGWHHSLVSGNRVDYLRLINGAKALVHYQPFAQDVKQSGLTISFEAKLDNVRAYDGTVISCYDEEGLAGGHFAGFRMSASRVELPIGGELSFVSEEGERINRHLGLSMPTAWGEYYDITLVIHPMEQERTLRLYINGVLSKAETYTNEVFAQRNPKGILFDSTYADIDLRSLRVWTTALSDDDVLNNYITDRPSLREMQELRKRNDVLDASGDVSYDKLYARGKAVLQLRMQGSVERLWGKSTDTKTNHKFSELIFRSPYGRSYDLRVTDGVVRRQGTSTSTYPVKNLRIYLQRNADTKVYRNLGSDGADVWELVSERTYVMRPGAKPMKVINLKTDYADSSLCYNTGTSILLNDYLVRKQEALHTPGMSADASARIGIDGMPIDLFSGDDGDAPLRYCGQFQFNNDKSKSGYLFGQTKKDGTEIALEFINNTYSVANFAIDGDVAEHLGRSGLDGFDGSVEFLYPEKDYLWNGKTSDKTAPENIKQAVIRLWQFIKDCCLEAGGGSQSPDPSGMTEAEVRRAFVSAKFKREVGQYFDVTNLTMWYVLTDYHMSVDQRVKNTFFRTWDGNKWYLTYYDGDTAFGKRNDAFLAYDYNINRDTRDIERSKYAFEGHNSRLWCLVIANLEEDLRRSAGLLRASLTNSVYLDVFNRQIMGNWSERQYNKSGIYKYIKPTYTDYNGAGVMNYIFALNGSMYALRNQLISRRFSMLDARYLVGQYESDAITGYIGKGVSRPQAGSQSAQIRLTAGDEYYFGWKTQNGKLRDYQHVLSGAEALFSFPEAMSQNDPIRLIGASRVRKLDFAGLATFLQGAWNLNSCPMLEEVIAPILSSLVANERVAPTPTPTPWFMHLRGISGLRRIDLTGQRGVSGTDGSASTEFDVSTHSGLRELLLGGTAVRSVRIADGSPLTQLVLPRTLSTLRLVALPSLRAEGLVLEDWASVRSLIISGCPLLDWQDLLGRCTSLERLRVEGVDFQDDGTLLERLSSLGGIGLSGEGVDTVALVGRCQLTRYMDDERLSQMRAKFPSLEVRQAKYSVYEIDESVADPRSISNLDNKTGYKFGNEYQPSGHLSKILKQRFACLGKQAIKGEMKVCRLHQDNFTRYADHINSERATEAVLDGTQGDIFIYEPRYWYKGVNDELRGKRYAVYTTEEPEALTNYRRIDLSELTIRRGKRLVTTQSSLERCMRNDGNYGIVELPLEEGAYKRVRFPLIRATGDRYGALFLDREGNIVGNVYADVADGMYVIADIPQGATHLLFSVALYQLGSERAFVLLSNSPNIEDYEPYWVEHKPVLIGAVKIGNTALNKMGSVVPQTQPYAINYNTSPQEFNQELERRGMRILNYDERKNIYNLLFFVYGNRNFSFVVGYNSDNTWQSPLGALLQYGMVDTERRGGYNWIRPRWGLAPELNVGSNTGKSLGYENLWSGTYETCDGVTRTGGRELVKVRMSDGSERDFSPTQSEGAIAALTYERYMDVTASRTGGVASHNTHYQASQNLRDNFTSFTYGNFGHKDRALDFHNSVITQRGHGYNGSYGNSVRILYSGDIEEIADLNTYLQIENNF